MRYPCQKLLPLFIILLCAACKNWRPAGLLQRTPRERYADELRSSPVGNSPAGRRWSADADSALAHPAQITLPYREAGRIPAGINAAAALAFDALQGERIIVRPTGSALPAFLELYRREAPGFRLLTSPDSGTGIHFDVPTTGSYLLLIQHSLQRAADYTLTLARVPSLAYPVVKPGTNRIGSVWGDSRDAGSRRHEGVDIFAARGTPALAAADGRITRVMEGGLGGKTVWLRPERQPYSLYYAHLDSQWVREGAFVRTGDTIGEVGNTGNARTTAPHLHFGIYGMGGAVDPAPFIRMRDTATAAPGPPATLTGSSRKISATLQLRAGPAKSAPVLLRLPSGTEVLILAASRDWLRLRAADTLSGWIPYSGSVFR